MFHIFMVERLEKQRRILLTNNKYLGLINRDGNGIFRNGNIEGWFQKINLEI